MLDSIMTARRSAGSWGVDPLSVTEIDAHPDADRIWATIAAMQGEYQRGYDEGAESVDADAVTYKEYRRCKDEIHEFSIVVRDALSEGGIQNYPQWIEHEVLEKLAFAI